MKKTALLLVAVLVLSVFMFASCELFPFGKECTEHVDANGDYICDNCEAELEKDTPDTPDDPGNDPGNDPGDEPDDPYVPHEHADANSDHKCDSEECEYISPCADNDGDYDCDICGVILFEEITYSLNVSDVEAGTRSEDDINGKFTIISGTEVRNRSKTFEGVEYNKSIKIGSKGNGIKVSVPGTGTLRFIIQNGSSGVDMQYTKVIAPDGTVQDIEFVAGAESNPLVLIEVEVTEGEWIIERGKNGGTQDIYYLELDCVVAVAPENGFELVSEGTTEFLLGDTLDVSKIRLNATYENGKTDTLDPAYVSIDTTAVDMFTAGEYDVILSYKEYAPITYKVRVYAPDSIELGFDAIEKLSQNSSAGNGVYFNHSFKEFYYIGEELDTKGLSVTVVGKCGEKELKFKVNEYTIEGFNPEEESEQTITVTAYGVSATTSVHVSNVEITPDENGVIQALVDPAYLGPRGNLSGPFHCFSTIQQALDFLAKANPTASKVITIAPGYYNEKLEITIPNLTIQGVGETPSDVMIEWNSLYGLVDASGFTHTTDSTATVAIRETAVNCKIDNITISNYWNSQDRMDEAGLAIERGLALLVQADRFTMTNSGLLGIQDTLELFTGRQYFENVFISGYTDFIFGTNNTTYFKDCTIHVIYTSKNSYKDDGSFNGTGACLTAFKGSNKGATDSIIYGAIFDGCKFTGDERLEANVSNIGRPWGAYAAVTIINSEIGGHISTKGFSSGKNERYISMNAKPTDVTVQYLEYKNTGAGAITEAVAGMRFLTAEEAALYADFATIFGTINGNVSYLDPWDPDSTEIVVDDRTYYYFNGTTGTEGTSYTYDQSLQGTTGTFGDIAIDATAGKVVARDSDTQMNKGAKLSFNVKAGTLVTVISYPGYGYYTLNGVGHNASEMFSQYYAEDTEVVMLATDTAYIYQIIINPNEEAPEAPILNEIKVSGMNVNYALGDEISLEGVVVKAIYSDNSVVTVSDYTVDTSAVVNSAEGSYDVVFSYGEKTVTVQVTFEDPNAGPEISKSTRLDFSTPDGLAAVQNNPKVTITGSVRHNGSEIQIQGTISFQVKAGTVVTVIPYANSQYASYTLGMEGEEGLVTYSESMSIMFDEDCTVVYTGLSNNYLISIYIECPLAEGKYVFGGSTQEGDVTGILESIPGMSISGTFNTHSGGAQLGANSQIIFIAPALATVTIQGYDTNYGQLLVLVDGEPVEMNANAQYVFTPLYPVTVIIQAVNVGTEEAPSYNKSYITYIDLKLPTFIEEDKTVSFGSAGNYKDSGIDFSGITIGDNGGNNSQIKNGSFSFAVRKGAKVIVHGYSGYASYNFGDGDIVFEGITDEYFTYEATADCVITISHTTGNNYFYSISIEYPYVFEEATTVDLSATGANIQGAKGKYARMSIDATNGKFADNNSGWVQVNAGTVISFNVAEGAQISVSANNSADNFTITITDGVCTITCTGNDYLKAISIAY